jgi:hypothetical protein
MSGDLEWMGMELFFSRARSHPTGRSKPGRGRRMREIAESARADDQPVGTGTADSCIIECRYLNAVISEKQ